MPRHWPLLSLLAFTLSAFVCGSCAHSTLNPPPKDFLVEGTDQAVVFGTVTGRITGNGTAAYVTARNIKTHQKVVFELKAPAEDGPSKVLCLLIDGGTYELLTYDVKESGEQESVQKLIKAANQEALEAYVSNGSLEHDGDDYPKYQLEIPPGSVTYIGHWELTNILPTFANDRPATQGNIAHFCPWAKTDLVQTALPY